MKKRHLYFYRKTSLLASLIAYSLVITLTHSSSYAANESIWIGKGNPSFHNEGKVTRQLSVYGAECREKTVKTADYTTTLCFVETGYGSFHLIEDYVPLNSHNLVRLAGGNGIVLANNNTEQIIRIDSNYELNAYQSPSSHIYRDIQGEKLTPNKTLTDTSNNKIQIIPLYAGISNNGKWLLAQTIHNQMIRINLDTFDFITFDIDALIPPKGEFTISNDGRYGFYNAVTTSPQEIKGRMTLVDFETCIDVTYNQLDVVANCETMNLSPFLESNGVEHGNATAPSFNTNATQLTLKVRIGGTEQQIVLSAPDHQYSSLDYLALGDSFTSGEGDSQGNIYYEPGTDIQENTGLPKGEKCHLSKRSYPYLLAKNMNMSTQHFRSVACSGAQMGADLFPPHEYHGQDERLKELDFNAREQKQRDALYDFTPGRIRQLDYVDRYKPKIVTISIGGNDVGFADVLRQCVLPNGFGLQGTCDYAALNASARASKAQEIQALTTKLKDSYEKIHFLSPQTKIYVLGYSKILKSGTACSYMNFNFEERRFIDEAFAYMNDVIEAAAINAGVGYINIEDALGEAVICGDENPRAVNGVKFGDDIKIAGLRVIGQESFHPNEHGHAKIAQAIEQQLHPNNLQTYDYCPTPGIYVCGEPINIPSVPAYFTTDQAPPTHWIDNIRILEDDSYLLGEQIRIQQNHRFKAHSTVNTELHSDPILLSQDTADEFGSIDTQITLPDDIPVGYHTLRIKGTLITDEPVEYYQTILIVGPEGDRDNNGTADHLQECLEAPISITHNGIDIYPCDMDIDETSEPQEPPVTVEPEVDVVQIIRNVIRDLWESISSSSIFQRLGSGQRQYIEARFHDEVAPQLEQTLTRCNSDTILNYQLSFLNIKITCKDNQHKFLIAIEVRIFGILIFTFNRAL